MATLPFSTNFAGPQNVYVNSFNGKQSANLVISYARDPKKFAVNQLATRTPTDFLSGLYEVLRPEALARIISDPNESIWVDGQERPKSNYNQQDYRAVGYQCQRRSRPAYVGWQSREQAVWDIQDTQLQVLAHQMMTQRALAFYNIAMNSNNHLSTHVKTATQWSNIGGTGGFWSQGTVTNPIIKRTLMNVANAIRQSTMDAVSYTDLTLVITPPEAIAMADSAEIHDYLARSQFALAQIRGDRDEQNGAWGLPMSKLYGMDVVVDGTLRTTSARLVVPGTTTDIMDANDNTALVIAAPGSLGENIGQVRSSFSSMHMFVYRGEEMVVETQDDTWNRRTLLSVHETYAMQMVAPECSALITNLFS